MVIKNCSKYINIMQNTESSIAVQDEGAVENVEQAKHAQEALAPNYDLEKELAGRTLANCVHKTFNFGESSLTDVDKFKRRLIRSIARYTFVDKMSQNEMWEKLRKDTDCDCFLLMKRMRALTLKKLNRLLAAEDELDNVTKVARLTTTDWLLFDLVLVHENVDLIGKESKSEKTEEPKVLTELFELVSKYKIEKYQGYKLSLTTAWLLLTIEYNSRGRQCSPMLLQRRWYQMKQVTRLKFYTFWYSYRGNTTRLQQAWDKRPTELETKIAKRFPHLIIQPFHEWEELVASEKVILREDFEKLTVVEPANNKNVDDVEIIETPVETIQVDEDSDVDDIETPQEQGFKPETNATKQSNGGELDVRIVNIKTEPSDNNPNNISPKREESFDEMNRISHCSDIDYDENNELLPKIMNVTGGVELIESDDEADVSVPQHDVSKDSSEMKDSNKNIEINTPNCGVNSEDVSNICSVSDSNKITDFADDRQDFEVQFDDLIIIDDGIAIEDDDIEDECEDMIQVKPEPEQPKENTDEEEDTPKFDFKLLLTPVVFTKKLDDMDVFKFIDFSTVRDKRIIECSNKESKPVDVQEKHKISKSLMSINVEQEVIQDNIAQAEMEKNVDIILELEPSTESDLISDHQKIKYSSWLLQKPKNRTYNPIQLCKNPDFNTRLKRLNAGFLMSERNRLMLKECKRLTVDLHKAFENKLIDGTLYLQNSKFTHNCNKSLDSHSFVESKTVKTLSGVDFLKETTKNVHITTNVDLKSAECNHESNLKYEYKIKNRTKVLLETSPETANQIHPLQINENESKETELNKDIQLDPLKKDAYGSCATEPNQYQQNSLKHKISGANCCTKYVDEKIEGKGHIVYKHSTQREPMQDGINSSTEKVVNEKIEAQENNINLETEQIDPNKDICDVDDAQKIEDDIIEPQESEPTNYRKGKKQLSRLQIQRSLSKLFAKVNYRSSTALPSRIPLKWDANSKPTQNSIKISDAYGDALLASSTLDKMFNVLSYQPIDNKLKKHKRKKVLEHLTGQKIHWRKKNVNNKNVENKSSDELKSAEDIDKNDNTGTEANGKVKNINNATNVKKDKSKDKNGVATKQTKSRYCCWALEKLLTNKQPETPHSCPHPVCICCCRDRLLEKTLQDKKALGSITKKRKVPNTEKVHTKNNLPANKSEFETNIEIKNQVTAEPMSIILSDDDEIDAKDDCSNIDESNKVNDCINVDTPLSNLQEFGPVGHLNESNDEESLSVQSTVPSIQIKITSPNQSTSSTQTSSSFSQTCTTRVFAGNSYNNNCNTSKTIEIPPLRVTFTSNNDSPKPTGQMARLSIQLGNANVTKSNSRKDQFKYNILPHSPETSKPIFLGENKILLYSHDKPDSTMSKQSSLMEENLSSDPFTQSLLPPGVQIVLLPSGELALSIQPGLEFSAEEIAKLSDILMSVQQQLTASVKNSSTTGNSETIDLVNQIEGNNEIPSQTKSNESILETKSSMSDHPKELATINNDDNSQSVVNIVPHDAENNAIDKNPDDTGIMLETQSIQTSNDTDSQINKKSILSDLMEMSGISEKDAVTEAKTLNTSKKSPVTPVISLAPEMGLNQTELGTNTQSKICRSPTISASLETRKELSVVSSFDELKKCHEKSCQFYKMDIKTGEIYPINLKIKKKPLASIKERRGKTLTTKVPSACIDLTEDQGEEGEKETEPKVVEKGNVKPVKLIRTIHSTGPNPTRSIILEPRQTSLRSQEPSPLVNILRSKRSLLKPHVDTGNDSSKPTILEGEIENGGSRSPHSDSESDDEPLAKKALRKRDDDATMLYSDVTEPNEISGPIDDIENSLQSTEEAMDEELMEPEFLDPDSGGEDEGCILGV